VVIVAVTEPRAPAVRAPAAASWEVLRDPIVFRLCLVNHLFYATTGIWSTFIPLYMVHLKLSVVTIGWLFTLQGLTYALVQIPTGRFADRIGPEHLILPGVIGRALLVAMVPLLHGVGVLLVAAAAFGLFGGVIPVTFTMLIARFSSREHYTSAMGVYNSSGDLGFFVGPLLGGIAALTGILGAFLLAVPLGIAAVLAAWRGIAAVRQADREV
jgi:MFS family permease